MGSLGTQVLLRDLKGSYGPSRGFERFQEGLRILKSVLRIFIGFFVASRNLEGPRRDIIGFLGTTRYHEGPFKSP